MLRITIPGTELWDEGKEEFVYTKDQTLQLEHSLVSLLKWESKWHKAFLTKREKTYEEVLDYIKCMTLTQNVKPEVYQALTKENIDEVLAYIEDPMTATHFSTPQSSGTINGEQTTAELLYYYMIESGVPFECQKWHLNRLITLIRVCSVKRTPPKKMGTSERLSMQARLNAERKQKLNTKG
jgi:hypothetical protein